MRYVPWMSILQPVSPSVGAGDPTDTNDAEQVTLRMEKVLWLACRLARQASIIRGRWIVHECPEIGFVTYDRLQGGMRSRN